MITVTENMLQQRTVRHSFPEHTFSVVNATENLLICQDIFNKAGFKAWLMYGTLLGVTRDNSLIEYDRDVDYGFFKSDLALFNENVPALDKEGFTLLRTHPTLFSITRKDEYIDFQMFLEYDKDKYYTCDSLGPQVLIDKKYFDNLTQIEWRGEKFIIPEDREGVLTLWYGKNYKIPKRKAYAYLC